MNGKQTNQKTSHTVKVIKQQQIELIVYIVQVCFLKAFPCKSYEDCYQNSLTIGKSWEPIIEVFSRIKYYELLCTKQLKSDFRKLAEQQTPPCSAQEYKQALENDIRATYGQVQIANGCEQTLANISIIGTIFYKYRIYEKIAQIMNCAVCMSSLEIENLAAALSMASTIELKVLIVPAYCTYSSNLLKQMLIHLIDNDTKLFERCYSLTFNHYQEIFQSKIPKIPEIGFEIISEIICTFLSKQMRMIKPEDKISHLDN